MLVLAHLRNGDTYARLAAGFGVATSTAWRYVHDTLALLAALAEDITQVAARVVSLAWVLLDGTLVPINRVAGQRRYYSGRHRRHGVNVQILADPFGRLIWASPPLPGATHDVTAARAVGVIDTLTSRNVETWADKAYQGAGGTIRTPYKRHRTRPHLSTGQKAVNRAHTRIRCRVEQAVAELKGWHVLDRLRCCPRYASTVIAAITVLNRIETRR